MGGEQSETFERELLELVPFGLMVWQLVTPDEDRSLTLLFHNAAASRLTGVDLDVRRGRTLPEVFGPNVAPHSLAASIREGRRRTLGRVKVCYAGPDAAPLLATAVPFGGDRALVVLESAGDLERVEREARSISRLVSSIFEHLPAMVFVKDAKTLRFERINRAAEELLGKPRRALLDRCDHDLFPSEQAEVFVAADREVLRSRVLKDIPREPIDTPSGVRWLHTRKIPILDEHGEPSHLLGVSIDVTDQQRTEEMLRSSHELLERHVRERTVELERQVSQRVRAEETLARTEEQLRHTQKMEAIGRLAGAIAHDFNNLLSVVVGYSDLLLSQLVEHPPLRKHVEQISQAGTRAANLTRQLLAFSRRQTLRPRVIDLNQVLAGLEEMLSRLVGEQIEVVIRRSDVPPYIEADPSQIEQVVMNLVVNARDAMPHGGRLRIETALVELDAAFIATHLGDAPGPYVRLSVQDNGVGMDELTLQRIFEPFFTTKEAGKGTGLGLATVVGIVKQRRGVVRAHSQPDCGATFEIFLPLLSGARRALPPVSAPKAARLRGSETILLVEDQEPVRALAATCLRELGYRVLEASSAVEATQTAMREPVQLLLTDIMMPGMNGSALAAQLLRRDPGLRVLFMSGHGDVASARLDTLAGRALLHKPITPTLLSQRVRDVLDGTALPASADQLSP